MLTNCILLEADDKNSLGGSCLNDLINMSNYLYNNINEIDNIFILTTKRISNKNKFPKICNFKIFEDKDVLRNIVNNLTHNSQLFVLISGHGYQIKDISNDEIDLFDEYIKSKNQIVLDDDLREIFILPIKKKNIKFIGIVDTCHSGTMFDLDYSYIGNKWIKDTKRDLYEVDAISIGACQDNQLDNCDLGNIGFGGSLTVHLIDNNLVKDLFNVNKVKSVFNKLSKIMIKLKQTPVLQTNKIF